MDQQGGLSAQRCHVVYGAPHESLKSLGRSHPCLVLDKRPCGRRMPIVLSRNGQTCPFHNLCGGAAIQLDYICDMELVYREESLYFDKFLLVCPYDGAEGTGYGEGDGTVTGSRIQGSLRWVNHPHRRSDGTMLPDAHGVIVTHDHAMIMFTLQGRTVFEQRQARQTIAQCNH